MDSIKKLKFDKVLLVLTLIASSLFNFLSYFNTPWRIDADSVYQDRRMGIMTTGLLLIAFCFLMALTLTLIFSKKYSKKIIVPILLLQFFGIFWTGYTYVIDKVSIGVLFRDSFPPISMLACGFVLAGYNDKFWPTIKKAIFIISCFFTIYSFYEILIAFAKFGFEYRIVYGAPMYCYEIGLFATYGLVILTDEWKEKRKLLVFILVLVLFFNSAILQGRSWFLQTTFLFVIYLFNIRKSLQKYKALSIFVPLGIIAVAAFIFIRNIELFEGLIDRFTSSGDTRTPQLQQFFEQVTFKDLLIGQGTKASYVYMNNPNFHFIDNQVLLFMFRYGMIPTFCYCFIILDPVLKSLILKDRRLIYKSLTMLVWFAAMMGVSVFFNISFGTMSMLILLYCGRLFYEIDNKNKIILENQNSRG